MEFLHTVVGPIATNVYVLGDERSREAIAIDTATPCVAWVTERLAARGWTLKPDRQLAPPLGTTSVTTPPSWPPPTRPWPPTCSMRRASATRAAWAPRSPSRQRTRPWNSLARVTTLTFGDLRLEVLHTPGPHAGLGLPAGADGGPAAER